MKVEDIMTGNRVCLKPQQWNDLYEAMIKVFPERKRPEPLPASEWDQTLDWQKRIRFCMHLEFAISAGVAEDFLKHVKEEHWYCKAE